MERPSRKPKPQRIQAIKTPRQTCLNGKSDAQDEEWCLPRDELRRVSREMYKCIPTFKKNLFFIPCWKTVCVVYVYRNNIFHIYLKNFQIYLWIYLIFLLLHQNNNAQKRASSNHTIFSKNVWSEEGN